MAFNKEELTQLSDLLDNRLDQKLDERFEKFEIKLNQKFDLFHSRIISETRQLVREEIAGLQAKLDAFFANGIRGC